MKLLKPEVVPATSKSVQDWSYFLHELLPRLDEQTYCDGIRGPLFRIQSLNAAGLTVVSSTSDYARVNGVSLRPLPPKSVMDRRAVFGFA